MTITHSNHIQHRHDDLVCSWSLSASFLSLSAFLSATVLVLSMTVVSFSMKKTKNESFSHKNFHFLNIQLPFPLISYLSLLLLLKIVLSKIWLNLTFLQPLVLGLDDELLINNQDHLILQECSVFWDFRFRFHLHLIDLKYENWKILVIDPKSEFMVFGIAKEQYCGSNKSWSI